MPYQTYQNPDGSVVKGYSPTIERFRAAQEYIDFFGRSILDLGCNICSFGMQAAIAGASSVVGMDENEEALSKGYEIAQAFSPPLNVRFTCADIEGDWDFCPDIVVASMILHWMKNPKGLVRKCFESAKETLIIIYRYPTDYPGEIGWRPEVDELNKAVGTNASIVRVLEDDGPNRVVMCIYDKEIRQN